MVWVALALVALLNIGTGFAVLHMLAGHRPVDVHAPVLRLLLLFGAGLVANSVLAMALLTAEWFSLPALAAADVALLAGALLVRRGRRLRWSSSAERLPLPLSRRSLPHGAESVALLLWIAAAAWLFLRPHEIVYGAADAGVYVNLGAYVADHGTLRIVDPVLAALDPALAPVFQRTMPDGTPFWSPGLLFDGESGRILPPFYHLQVAWLAVVHRAGGTAAALLLTPFMALWSALAVYAVLRDLLPRAQWWLALVALGALTISAIEVWFARYPTTEPLTQLLFWLGLWAFARWQRDVEPPRLWSLLAGGAWGATFLVRVDTFFVWIVPAVLLLLWLRARRIPDGGRWFLAPLLLLPLQATVHALRFARPYFLLIYGNMLDVAAQYAWVMLPAALLGGLLLWLYWRRQEALWPAIERAWPLLRGALAATTLLLFLYGWFLRPLLGEPLRYVNPWDNIVVEQWNHMTLRHMGWYFSPLGVALACAGSMRLFWRLDRRSWALTLLGALFSLLYLWNIRSNAIQMYALRRYVPLTVPFFIVAATVALGWLLGQRRRRWQVAGLGVALLWIAGLGWSSRGLVSHVDYRGLPAGIDNINAQLPAGSILLFNQSQPIGIGDHLGVPLTLTHGHHALIAYQLDQLDPALLAAQIDRWQRDGQAVFWVDLPHGHPWPLGLALEPLLNFSIPLRALETTYDRRPTDVTDAVWSGAILRVSDAGPVP